MAPFQLIIGSASFSNDWRSHLFHSPSSLLPVYYYSFMFLNCLVFFSFPKSVTLLVGYNRVVRIGSCRYWDLFLPVIWIGSCRCRFLLLLVLRVMWFRVPLERVGWHTSFIRLQPETICPFADDFSCQRAELVQPIVLLGYLERSGPPNP